jgi:hypothetical protein
MEPLLNGGVLTSRLLGNVRNNIIFRETPHGRGQVTPLSPHCKYLSIPHLGLSTWKDIDELDYMTSRAFAISIS